MPYFTIRWLKVKASVLTTHVWKHAVVCSFYCKENQMHRALFLHPPRAVTTVTVLESSISLLPDCLWHLEWERSLRIWKACFAKKQVSVSCLLKLKEEAFARMFISSSSYVQWCISYITYSWSVKLHSLFPFQREVTWAHVPLPRRVQQAACHKLSFISPATALLWTKK